MVSKTLGFALAIGLLLTAGIVGIAVHSSGTAGAQASTVAAHCETAPADLNLLGELGYQGTDTRGASTSGTRIGPGVIPTNTVGPWVLTVGQPIMGTYQPTVGPLVKIQASTAVFDGASHCVRLSLPAGQLTLSVDGQIVAHA